MDRLSGRGEEDDNNAVVRQSRCFGAGEADESGPSHPLLDPRLEICYLFRFYFVTV